MPSNPSADKRMENTGQEKPIEGQHAGNASRRRFLKYAVAGVVVALVAGYGYAYLNSTKGSGKPNSLNIAWNDQILTLHPYALHRSSPEESPLDAIYDRYIQQDRNFNFNPGVVSSWSWGSDNKSINMTVRNDVKFHDGTQCTADDIAFSLQTAGAKGMAYGPVWDIITGTTINSSTSLTLELSHFDPGFPKWFGFLDAFIIPKAYYQKVGSTAFGQNPIATGPYQFVSYSNGVLKLRAFPDYWQGPAPIENVVFSEVLDPTARASDIKSGQSDFTLQVDVKTYSALASTTGLVGQKPFTTDVASFFVAPYFPPFKDQRVRLALHYALDKNSLVNNVLLGFGRPLSMPEAPGYLAYDPNFNFPYDAQQAKSLLQQAGYGQGEANGPLNLTVMTTQGVTTKDYEIAQAAAQMWQNIGINVHIDVVTVAQFFTARTKTGTLDALSFYVWSNSTGDPENDVFDMMDPQSPFSAWSGMIAAGETDYTGLQSQCAQQLAPIVTGTTDSDRAAAGRAASEWVVNNGLLIPLYQQAQPLVMKSTLNNNPWPQGWVRPYYMSWT